MKNFIIKMFGGFTQEELNNAVSKAQKSAFRDYKKTIRDNYGIKRSYGYLKSEIHRKLDILFPGREFDKARYRWLRRNTMTTTHISKMDYKELKAINKKLGDI